MSQIAVGTTNPVKINAVTSGFKRVWPKTVWNCTGIEVNSGVSDQPLSDEETINGAINRAKAAISKLDAEYGVGLEGGVHKINGQWFDCGWIAVIDQKGAIGLGSTARIIVPEVMVEYLMRGKELGDVIDLFFNQKNSKQNQGHFGLMTKNTITRTSGYSDGVVMALARFINPQLF